MSLFWSKTGHTQQRCLSHENYATYISDEVLVATAETSGGYIEVYVNPSTSVWTVWHHALDAPYVCLSAAGKNWTTVPSKIVPGKDA